MDIIGLNDYSLARIRKGWDKDNGETRVFVYEGPIAKVDNLYDDLKNDDTVDSINDISQMAKGVLEVTYEDGGGGGEQNDPTLNVIWEVVGQDLFKSLRSHEFFNQDDDQEELEDVRRSVLRAKFKDYAGSEPETTYQQLLQRGTEDFVRTQAILRASIQLGARSTVQASWVGVDQAWKLNGESGSPNLPTAGEQAIIGALENMPEYDATKKQWLKRAPQIRKSTRRKYSLSYDWWFAANWSEILYDGTAEDDGSNP